jgi:hypothetical protein
VLENVLHYSLKTEVYYQHNLLMLELDFGDKIMQHIF